jgi:hypothetical protein
VRIKEPINRKMVMLFCSWLFRALAMPDTKTRIIEAKRMMLMMPASRKGFDLQQRCYERIVSERDKGLAGIFLKK